MHTFENFFHFR